MTVATRPVDPGERASRTGCGARPRRGEAAGSRALLIGVGADLRYLTGYEAMPLERLTMLVLGPRNGADARRARGSRSGAAEPGSGPHPAGS